MSAINESLNHIAELLLDPLEQKPSIKLRLGALLREFQNFYNELGNSSVPWTTKEFQLTVDGDSDHLITTENVGKILFVSDQSVSAPYSLDFVDFRDASVDWWYSVPVVGARPEDYNYTWNAAQIAFYRKNGSLYAKTPNLSTTLTVVAATGDWASNVGLSERAVMSEYHHLPEIRASKAIAPRARWSEDAAADEIVRRNIRTSLDEQEQRVYEQFVVAKRSQTADTISFRDSQDWVFD